MGVCERGEPDILDPSPQLIHRGRKKYRLTPTSVKSCNVEFLFIRHRGNNETHLPAICDAQKANAWFSSSHENRRRRICYPGPARQGTSPPWGAVTRVGNSRNRIIRFPKTHRLHKAEEFSSVIRFRCSACSELLQVFAKPNGLLHSRLGLIVAGKIERLAVNRNRVKRVLREVFRTQQEMAGLDVVVRLRRRVSDRSSFQLADEAQSLMIQLQRCRG